MWQAISSVLTSGNALQTLLTMVLLFLVLALMTKTGLLRIKTSHVQVGLMTSEDRERTIIREQCDWVHTYIKGLESKISSITPDLMYGGYFTKYVLECVYDEIVKWITFNHLMNTESYIHAKQIKIACLVYSFNVRNEFKTPEFNTRMHKWVREIIEELIKIRELYSKQ